jgi:opacity protein-like surface antigen
MKSLLFVAVSAFTASSVWAQADTTSVAQNVNVAADFASTSAAAQPSAQGTNSFLWSAGALRLANMPSGSNRGTLAAEPAEAPPASPDPKFVYGGRDDFRWQLALGVAIVRFRSSLYYATGVGSNTSVTYFTNQWLGFEGSVNTSFAPTIFQNENVKVLTYGAGPKVAWRARKLEPWAHVIVGGAHVLPQTAGHGQNGFAMLVGGGADYRIYPHLSARLELDWIKTHLFGQWQNSAQANADIVLHF